LIEGEANGLKLARPNSACRCTRVFIGADVMWIGVMAGSPARAEEVELGAAKEAFAYLHEVAMHPRCMKTIPR
jgi:hypothetical protein